MAPADHSAGNKGSRYQYTVRGDHVQLRCVGDGYVDDEGVTHITWQYEASMNDYSVVLRDDTDAGLLGQMEANGVPITDGARAWLDAADCPSMNT